MLEEVEETEEGRARRVAGRGLTRLVPHGPSCSWGTRKPGAGGEHVIPVRPGGESRVSTEPGEPHTAQACAPKELRGDHLEPLHGDLVTESRGLNRPILVNMLRGHSHRKCL